ncbi:MAG TPA: GNAT family N-acetyltransferase [Jatrophihabitans sp.]|nr:GNAT family N-acetyltransferase [Jatrophihabitans sp.]
MTVGTTTDTAEILGRIEPVLMADPIRNNVFGTVRLHLRVASDGGWCAHNGVALAVRCSPDHPIALTSGWTDLDALCAAVRGLPSVSGIGGPVDTVDALVERLAREPSHRMAERLYRLDRLVEPSGVAGRGRLAGAADTELVAGWLAPYTCETYGELPPGFDAVRLAAAMVGVSRTWLWLAPDDRPVSMAARRPPAAGVSRIGPVYTPPDQRRRGYGTAVTARAAFDILDSTAVPVLYTDVANPTSNKIYRAIGFRPVADRASVSY